MSYCLYMGFGVWVGSARHTTARSNRLFLLHPKQIGGWVGGWVGGLTLSTSFEMTSSFFCSSPCTLIPPWRPVRSLMPARVTRLPMVLQAT